MKELSLNILDIAQNSVKARAKNILIKLTETDETLTLLIEDDGCGMSREMVENADGVMIVREKRADYTDRIIKYAEELGKKLEFVCEI